VVCVIDPHASAGDNRSRGRHGRGPVSNFGGRSEIGIELARRLAPGRRWCWPHATPTSSPKRSLPSSPRARTACTHGLRRRRPGSHGPLVASIIADRGPIATAVLAFGILGDQPAPRRRRARRRHRCTRLRRSGQPATHLAGRDAHDGPGIAGGVLLGRRRAVRRRTTSTDRPRPAWTASPTVWPTPSMARGSGC